MTKHHPLDFSSLKKGDVISRETLEEIYHPLDESELRIRMMDLAGKIESERPDLVVGYKGLTLRILQDKEADDVTFERVKRGARSIIRNSARRSRVDRSKFDDTERRIAEHRDRYAAMIALATHNELSTAIRGERALRESNDEEKED